MVFRKLVNKSQSQICRMLSARGSRPYWGVLLPLPAAPPPPSSTAFYISAVFFKSDLYNTDCLCTLICTILSAYFYCILPAGCLLLLSCAMLTVFFFCILHSTILVTFLYCISLTDRPLLCYCACCAFLFHILHSRKRSQPSTILLLLQNSCPFFATIFCTNSALF